MSGLHWAWAPTALLALVTVSFAWGHVTGRRRGRAEGAARRTLELRAEALGTGNCPVCTRTLRVEEIHLP